jgi:hypothetical protein
MNRSFSRIHAGIFAATLAGLAVRAGAYGDKNPYPYSVHPGFTVSEINMPKVSTMGINWLANGDMVLTTCRTDGDYGGGGVPDPNAESGVWIVSGITGANPVMKQIASMFRQPTGAVVVNDVIYVSDRDAFYKINSLTPGSMATNRTKVIDWPKDKTAGFSGNWTNGWWHQWVFCPMYYNDRFYAPFSGTIVVGGPSNTMPSTAYSGAMLSWTADGVGGLQKFAGGFRSPNGANMGPSGMMMVADNQGSWEPSCPLDLIRQNRFYGHRQNATFAPNWAQAANEAGDMPYEPPVAWMLDGDAPNGGGPGQATSQPLYLDRGPYAGDWIVGDNNSKGISRVTLDPVDGGAGATAKYNGSVTFFTNGFGAAGTEAGVNRLAWHPTQPIIYAGTIGTLGNWPKSLGMPFYAITLDAEAIAKTFEIRAVRSRQGGVEMEFTLPIDPATALARNFLLNQYQIKRQDGYGAGNDQVAAPIISDVKVSEDKQRVYLAIGDAAAVDRVLKIAPAGIRSATGGQLYFKEAYFTHNYQSHQAFQAGSTRIAQAPVDGFLRDHVTYQVLGPALEVEVDLKGGYSVSLRSMDGSLQESRPGRGPARFQFHGGRGLRVLQVSQAGHAYVRPVIF